MANHFWRDGGTRKVFIKGIDGLYDDLRLTVRQTTNAQIEAHLAQVDGMLGATEDALRRKGAEFVANQIQAWDACDGDSVAPVNADNIMALQRMLYRRVQGVVYGADGGDADPKATAANPEATATVEEREKNSAAG